MASYKFALRAIQGDLFNPGAFHWDAPEALAPQKPHYSGKLVVLVDESTMSSARKRAICKMLKEMLDGDFLEDRLRLAVETDNRRRSIDVNQDFYYIDDWADEYTIKQFGENFCNADYGKRILRVDPYGDGTDILDWLENISLRVK